MKHALQLIIMLFILQSCNTGRKALSSTSNGVINKEQSKLSPLEEVKEFQQKLIADYQDPSTSPLGEGSIKSFFEHGGFDFFPIDSTFRITANFDLSVVEKGINFKTTTDRIAVYDVYGIAKFQLDGKDYAVKVYQSQSMREMEEYKDYLFLPFYDSTNGDETYGGGRYIDLKIPSGNKITIDFNKAYNPYCAYSTKYSCPIPPKENNIDFEIKAGVKHHGNH